MKKIKYLLGYNLVEIMVVLAIVGIAGALALPFYQDYIDRTKVSEGFNLVAPVQLAVAQYALEHNGLLGADSNQVLGVSDRIQGTYVSQVQVSSEGVITVSYSQPEGTIEFKPSYQEGHIAWDCSGGTLPANLRPSRCRGLS